MMRIGHKFGTDRPARDTLRSPRPPQAANSFLFAEVGILPNGTPLTVMSMLAQQDIDPWDEVARLRDCPAKDVVARLAALIRASGVDLPGADAPATVASRLVRLLYLSQWSANAVRRVPAGRMAPKAAGADIQLRFVGPRRAHRLHALRLGILIAAVITLVVIGLANSRELVTNPGLRDVGAPLPQASERLANHPAQP